MTGRTNPGMAWCTRSLAVSHEPGVHDGAVEMRERRPGDRVDAVLRVPASTLTQLLYQRIGPFTAVRRGLRIVGGRRPWLALELMSYFDRPERAFYSVVGVSASAVWVSSSSHRSSV